MLDLLHRITIFFKLGKGGQGLAPEHCKSSCTSNQTSPSVGVLQHGKNIVSSLLTLNSNKCTVNLWQRD